MLLTSEPLLQSLLKGSKNRGFDRSSVLIFGVLAQVIITERIKQCHHTSADNRSKQTTIFSYKKEYNYDIYYMMKNIENIMLSEIS